MTLEHRVAILEQTNRRYRWYMIGLAGLLLLTVAVGAAQVDVSDNRELVLKKLVIVDDEGRQRIVLGTFPSSTAGIAHFDPNGKMRITAGTFRNGDAAIQHRDRNGKMRISTGTAQSGAAAIRVTDAEGKRRISTMTSPTQPARSSAASPDLSHRSSA